MKIHQLFLKALSELLVDIATIFLHFQTKMGRVACPLACLLLLTSGAGTAFAEDKTEDAPIEDAPPTTKTTTTEAPADTADDAPVVITKSQWNQFLARQKALEDELASLKGKVSGTATAGPVEQQPPDVDQGNQSTTRPASGNRSLLLPDISLVVQSRLNMESDRRAGIDRRKFSLDEAELGIQGYVYPNVKADVFITAAPGEDEPFAPEEAYLTFIGLRKGLNVVAGRKFAPFGRTGEQHTHSWLAARQFLPRKNLISDEALTGDGLLARYLLPTGKKLFANLDVGVWNATDGAGVVSTAPLKDEILSGTGSGFVGRFYTGRLWASKSFGRNNELELGSSWARGDARIEDDGGKVLGQGQTTLYGLDASWRRFFSGPKRLLLRSEYFKYQPGDGFSGATNPADGWYGLANYRLNKRDDVGLLYESSGFPQDSDLRETASSVIFTRQFTEQFYMRLQATHGDRPGDGAYNQAILQMCWGLGPHTHNLE